MINEQKANLYKNISKIYQSFDNMTGGGSCEAYRMWTEDYSVNKVYFDADLITEMLEKQLKRDEEELKEG